MSSVAASRSCWCRPLSCTQRSSIGANQSWAETMPLITVRTVFGSHRVHEVEATAKAYRWCEDTLYTYIHTAI
jgi:hypothetical protein